MNAWRNILPPTLTITVCAAAFVLMGFTPVQSPAMPASIQVRTGDLDFNRPEDAQTLVERIEEASVQACGGAPDYRDVHLIGAFERCRSVAIKQAVSRVNQPLVSELAEIRTPRMRLAVR